MKLKLTNIVLLFSIVLFFVFMQKASALANEGDYFIDTYNISYRMKYGLANAVFVGDSITSPINNDRIRSGAIKTWKPRNWRGIIGTMSTGVTDQGTTTASPPTGATETSISPGGLFPNGSSGWNVGLAKTYNFTSDKTYGATLFFFLINSNSYTSWLNENSTNDQWTNSTNLTGRFIYLSDQNSIYLRLGWRNKSGVSSAPANTNTYLNNTPYGIHWADINVSEGVNGTISSGIYLASSLNINESLPTSNQFYPLGYRIFRNDISAGLQLGAISESGYSTYNHTNVTSSYSDYALQKWIQANELNIFMIWLGQNSAPGEWNGITTGGYETNIKNIIKRYADAYYSVNATSGKPYFLLISIYDTATSNTKYVLTEDALVNITKNYRGNPDLQNVEIGVLKLREKINITNGSFSTWQSTYLADGIHPNTAGANYFADIIWNEFEKSLSTPNGTIQNFSWESDSYKLINYSLESDSILFNNTGVLNSTLNIYNLTNSLIFYNNLSTAGSLDINSNDNNINISIPSGMNVTILNNFTLSESSPRNNSQIWFSSSSSTTKTIASNITSTLNVTAEFSVSSCDISSVSYVSHTGAYTKTYSSGEYSCSGGILTLNITGLETASGSNTLSISYTSVSSTPESTTSLPSSATIPVTSESVEKGVERTLLKNWEIKFKISNEQHSVKLEEIRNDSVKVKISSTPIYIELMKNEEKKVDLDSNGNYDLLVKLTSLSKASARIFVKKISEPVPSFNVSNNESQSTNTTSQETQNKQQKAYNYYPIIISALVIILILAIALSVYKKKRK